LCLRNFVISYQFSRNFFFFNFATSFYLPLCKFYCEIGYTEIWFTLGCIDSGISAHTHTYPTWLCQLLPSYCCKVTVNYLFVWRAGTCRLLLQQALREFVIKVGFTKLNLCGWKSITIEILRTTWQHSFRLPAPLDGRSVPASRSRFEKCPDNIWRKSAVWWNLLFKLFVDLFSDITECKMLTRFSREDWSWRGTTKKNRKWIFPGSIETI